MEEFVSSGGVGDGSVDLGHGARLQSLSPVSALPDDEEEVPSLPPLVGGEDVRRTRPRMLHSVRADCVL